MRSRGARIFTVVALHLSDGCGDCLNVPARAAERRSTLKTVAGTVVHDLVRRRARSRRPWMREHIRPLLAGDTQRSVAEVIASAER